MKHSIRSASLFGMMLLGVIPGAILMISGPAAAQSLNPPPTPLESDLFDYLQDSKEMQEQFQDALNDLREKNYASAEAKLTEVIDYSPENPRANYYMAIAKIGGGKMAEAPEFLSAAIDNDKNYVEARDLMAVVSLQLGDREAAEEQLAELQKMQAKCERRKCDDKAKIEASVEKLSAALA
jgi:predicted Zn-dependent protease